MEYLNTRTGQPGRAVIELDCQAEFQREYSARFLSGGAGAATPLSLPAAPPFYSFAPQPQAVLAAAPAPTPGFYPLPSPALGPLAGPLVLAGAALQTPLLGAQPGPALGFGGGLGGFGGAPVYL